MDITRFHATFFEESREGLDAMESGLLALESGDANPETINTIFRAAHSIKGGAGTFGFQAVAGFTHILETLLDEMRGGRREVSNEAVAVLIESTDVLRMLLESAEQHSPVDADMLARGEQSLQAMMGGGSAAPAKAAAPAAKKAAPAAAKQAGWQIGFKPMPSMYMTGNDPLRILRELERLGPLSAEFDGSAVPSFTDLDPFQTFLAWNLTLKGNATRATVDDAFSWVEDECELAIASLAGEAAVAAEPEPESAAAVAAAVEAPAVIPGRRADDTPDTKVAVTGGTASATEASIRVGISKVDALINLIGELVITQSMLKQTSSDLDPAHNEALLNGLTLLERNTRDLQETVMSVRMLPMESVFSRFPRVVRDVAGKIGKQVRLRTSGESTELDRSMIEKIVDPLTHLVRNAVDHGLETPDLRIAAGKEPTGTVGLTAAHQGGHIMIQVTDDGRGLNRERILVKAAEHGIPVHDGMPNHEVWQLIFHPGLSTAEKVTDLSGRGVGMDVVKKNIVSLGGSVDIASEVGFGSTVTIRLPLTLAILDGMSVSVGGEIFILPLASVLESLQPKPEDIRTLSGSNRMIRVRGDYVPMIALHEVFGVANATDEPHKGILVLVEIDNRKLALLVDELVGQQQVVIKNLESNYRRVDGISGATILGDGRVALIVDVGGLTRGESEAA